MATLLAITLGVFGTHHYYLGSPAAGLLIVLMNCFGVGPIVSLVEGFMLLVMSREEFDAKYNERRPEQMEFVFQQRP